MVRSIGQFVYERYRDFWVKITGLAIANRFLNIYRRSGASGIAIDECGGCR